MNRTRCFVYFLIANATLVCSSCSYIQHYQQQEQYSQIQKNISSLTLDQVNEYTSRTPFHKTYEFEFKNTSDSSFALIFYLNESSFSKSIIKHRQANELHRKATRIDESKLILHELNKNLPKASVIAWRQVANHIAVEEARDGYHVMQEYIRLKIRDL